MKSLNNKVIAITGASSGIGRALAIQCANEGAKLALSDVNETELNKTVMECRKTGVLVHSQIVDVAKREDVEKWASDVNNHFGSVNCIINNAGVNVNCCVEEMSYDDFEWVMDIDFWGVVYGTKAFLPYIKQAGEGHIVNISSIFGIMGIPNQSAYNSAKFAVKGFTESLSIELKMQGSPIGITCVHPGGVKTNIVNDSRMGKSVGKQYTREQSEKYFQRLAKTTPEQASDIILNAVKNNTQRVLVGQDAKMMDIAQRTMPTNYRKLILKAFS